MRQGFVLATGLMFFLFAGCDRASPTPAQSVDSTASASRAHESTPANEIRLEYRITVPEHVKGTITICTKSIDMERVVDYREEYRWWHRYGWDECRERFVHPHPVPAGEFTDDLDIPFPQCNGYQSDARDAGLAECTAAIKSLTDRYGEVAVREALKRQLEAKKTKGNRK